jgi:GAG-pre-integrase domain
VPTTIHVPANPTTPSPTDTTTLPSTTAPATPTPIAVQPPDNVAPTTVNDNTSPSAFVSPTVQAALDSLQFSSPTPHTSPQRVATANVAGNTSRTFRGAPVMHTWDPNNPSDNIPNTHGPRNSFAARDARDNVHRDNDGDRYTLRSPPHSHGYTPSFPTTYGHHGDNAHHAHHATNRDNSSRPHPTYTMLQGYAMDRDSYLRSLSDVPNFKDFVRSYYIPVHHPSEPIGMWYRRFITHGATNGIYVPPYESVTAAHSLGDWFDTMPEPIRCNVRIMSQYISTALNQTDVFAPNSPERLIVLNNPDGYAALYNLLSDSHPSLKDTHQFNDCPRQFESEPFLGFLTRFKSWALDELATGHTMSDYHLLGKVIAHVHKKHSIAVNLHIGHQYRQLRDGDPIPHALHLEQLASTMDSAVRIYGNTAPPRPINPYSNYRSRSGNGRLHALTEDNDSGDEPHHDDAEIDLLIQQISSQSSPNGGCFCCESTEHNAADCSQLLAYVQMQLLLNERPKLRSQIISKLRPNGAPPRNGSRTAPLPRGPPRSSSVHQLSQDTPTAPNTDPVGADEPTNTGLMHRVCVDNALDLDYDPTFDASLQCFSCSDLVFESPTVLGHEAVSPFLDSDLDDSAFASSTSEATADVNTLAGTPSLAPLPQIDNGSQATTTADKSILWCYRPYQGNYTLRDAGNNPHYPIGVGYLKIPTRSGHHFVACFHTPSIPSTIISPSHLSRHQRASGYILDIDTSDPNNTSATLVLKHRLRRDQDIHILMSLSGGLTHSLPAIVPTHSEHLAATLPVDIKNVCPNALPDDTCSAEPRTYNVHILNREAQRVLWHNRLGHLHSRRVADLYKCTSGIPKLDLASDIDKCPTCLIAKARRTARNTEDSRTATVCNQGISADFGIIIQQSTDSQAIPTLQGPKWGNMLHFSGRSLQRYPLWQDLPHQSTTHRVVESLVGTPCPLVHRQVCTA